MRGVEDAGNLEDAFNHTKELFLSEFGESLADLREVFSSADAETSSECEGTECGGTACGSSNCGKASPTDFSSRPALLH